MRHPVIFGTPGTVKNGTDKLSRNVAAIVVDEAHGLTPTIRYIIDEIGSWNPKVRVIGLTATPFRLDTGYIFKSWPDGTVTEQTNEPYFARLVERITARELIEQGYLTPPKIGVHEDIHYDVSGLEVSNTGRFTAKSVDRAFVGHGRKTSKIIADVIDNCRYRHSVLLFAASREHAQEVLASLPPELSDYVDGNTPKAQRRKILGEFKSGQIKYLVNIDVLTTGFDAERIDCVVLLRHTESAGLMQQMIGRGLRLHNDKIDCLVLDYADNIETHTPD